MKKLSVLILVAFLLSGCAGMDSDFECHKGSGGACVPMDRVNKLADGGYFSNAGNNNDGKEVVFKNQVTGYPLNAYAGQPIRSGEIVQQIWIAPYQDKAGNYYEPEYLYTVLNEGHWVGNPVQELDSDD